MISNYDDHGAAIAALETRLQEAEGDRDRMAAELLASQAREAGLRGALEVAGQEMRTMATEGRGFSCSIIDEIEAALASSSPAVDGRGSEEP